MPKQGRERAHGPYKHGKQYRVVFVGVGGVRDTQAFTTEDEAIARRDAFNRAANSRTLGEAVGLYVATLRTGSSADTARFKLESFLQLTKQADRILPGINAGDVRRWLDARSKDVAYETLRSEFGYASRLFDWCVDCGWMRINPAAGVSLPAGERSRGKPQLRADEARRFLESVGGDFSVEVTAVLMALLMGLRAHEIVERTVRDLDDGGRLLVIGKSKSKAGERIVAVPELVRLRLLGLASGRKSDQPLLVRLDGRPLTRHTVHYHTVRLIAAAGLPRVTPHGLRGTFATLALMSGLPGGGGGGPTRPLPIEQLARVIGHADRGTTLRGHYLAPGAEQSAEVNAVETFLDRSVTNGDPTEVN